jgi:hypothetical protein
MSSQCVQRASSMVAFASTATKAAFCKPSIWYNNICNDIPAVDYINEVESGIARNIFIRNVTFKLRSIRHPGIMTRILNSSSEHEGFKKIRQLHIFPGIETLIVDAKAMDIRPAWQRSLSSRVNCLDCAQSVTSTTCP